MIDSKSQLVIAKTPPTVIESFTVNSTNNCCHCSSKIFTSKKARVAEERLGLDMLFLKDKLAAHQGFKC